MSGKTKNECDQNPAWTAVVAHKLDKLRVNALSEGRPLRPGCKIGSRISILLTFFPDDVKTHIERVPPPVDIPKKLPEGMTERQYREMVLDYPEGDGMSIMQILADRIAAGDKQFVEDFAAELKPLNKGEKNANANRTELYRALLQNHAAIEKLASKEAITNFLQGLEPEITFTDSHLKSLLRELGLPRKNKG